MSERRAKRERKEQVPAVEAKKKSVKGILFNIIAVLVIVAVTGLGGYAAYDQIKANKATDASGEEPQTVETLAQQKEITVDELLDKVGMKDEKIKGDTSAEEFLKKMTIENFAKYNDQDVTEFKAMYGIENVENDTLWSDAQMEIKMGKVAEVEFGLSFDEFVLQNSLPKEITADMTQAEALKIMESQQAKQN